MEAQSPERIYRQEPLPDLKELRAFISSKKAIKAFDSLLKFLDNNYNFEQQIVFGGKNFGVMIRYRKNGKTLVSIFPEKDAFSVVLVYGKKEVITFEANRAVFDSYMTDIFDNTPQLHDGRWMLITLNDSKLLPELEKMIMIKKSMKKQ
ncbi:hypothetical protein GGR21_003077 [Dysgonomonas hofstadii]|uniref:DUF3788 domain-containing protein n=1 Tax=Dysgonomonas hofstadii TaxID=637886 RepID=A0A840CXK8_9BACT|nr:DUF3788 family protein [Dysgonomonas hofstadii]MBB4037162.1 hypothetical protein [Dysgonomonas hofstadii]